MVELELFKQAVLESRDGVTIADARKPDQPLVFVNPAFERLTGYEADDVLGRNCRFLQGDDFEPVMRASLHQALADGRSCCETVPNYRRDGTLFWNELTLSPIHGADGVLTHFIGIQRDVTRRVQGEQQIQAQYHDLERTKVTLEKRVALDPLTGVYNRRHFDDRLAMMWKIAARSGDPLALFFIDIDHFKQYNDYLGHPAGDRALVAVAKALGERFQRGSDFLARYGGEEFVVLASGMSPNAADRFAQALCSQVRMLHISHPGTPGGQLTISVGYDVVVPRPPMESAFLLECADQALFAAKAQGRDCAVGFQATGTAAASASVVAKSVSGVN